MKSLMLFAGLCLLVGGSIQMWSSVAMRRRGGSWRGLAVGGTAVAVWGALTLTGMLPGATPLGVGLVFVVAGAVWAGAVLTIRDARKSRSVR
jgi:uncharacterized membrane protein HdeD (DUF308 family)